MRRKSLGICVLLLGLLLGTSSSAYADTIAITSVSLSNFQIVPASGTVVFSTPQSGSPTTASGAAANSLGEELGNSSLSPTFAQALTSITFASAGGTADLATMSVKANSSVLLPGCVCSAETEGLASLRLSFMITGGTGAVDVTLSGLSQTMQNLVTDEFSLFAVSESRISLNVIDVGTFSFNSSLRIGPNDSTTLDTQRQLSQAVTLQFGHQYDLIVFVGSNSRAAQNEVPEPASVVLLVSGLGFMAGFVRKRRIGV